MAGNKSYTIVEYFGGEDGYRCGYCKSQTGNFSRGMWSHTMTVQDYQDLIDRGWRRSGKYVYKPIMQKTCCPQYTIRCHALKFQPSKSHKKILKKMNRFISKGELQKGQEDCAGEPMDSVCEEAGPQELRKVHLKYTALTGIQKDATEFPSTTEVQKEAADATPTGSQTSQNDPVSVLAGTTTSAAPKPGNGADPSRPPCRKAKELRKERRLQKEQMRQNGDGVSSTVSPTQPTPSQNNQSKTLEEFISESLPENSAHCLEFKRFLCDSPLEAEYAPDGPEVGYGSFHQQYWLDGRIVAVGVIDILPTCVSSVYLYYHPDFNSLSLGSYSALREIAFTKQLQKQSPKLSYYYLGFYIHSCPKMRYKGQYRPSDLLCPETYVWVSIERCIPLLDNSRYARLNQDPDLGDARAVRDLGRALVLYRRTVMPYAAYSRKRKGSSDEMEVQQYASLVGQDCAERILLYRS
ncbi:arginyl-tRNA--protein transferase 1 isoform X6 [Astatotilapia calliptera]|uniref:Arginyl-tRNA--protein transferase 1 n=1 Tax=Astatotilapia calliptera TaxID=8154 RepID=A0A3P8QU98_ASTCA|nr:arginyl-tRNA--protein transferase 1 isoform X6 [Maylandia zebra]XP_026046754.1 arginyl-tRNA--protein transferase 1 isoform X6 [Astatotilapia calliptera]